MILSWDSSVSAALDSRYQQLYSQTLTVLQVLPKNCKMETARNHSWPVRKGSRSRHGFSSQQANAKISNIRIGFSKPFQRLWASWSPPLLCFQQNGSPESTHSSFGAANVFSRKNILILKKSQWTLFLIYRNILAQNLYNCWSQNTELSMISLCGLL